MWARRIILGWGIWSTLLAISVGIANAQDPPKQPAVDPQAAQVLNAWSKYTTELRSFSVTIESATQIRQGEATQDRDAQRELLAERPGKLALHLKSAGGAADLVSDGKTLTVSLSTAGKYFVDEEPERTASWASILQNPYANAMASEGYAGTILTALLDDDPAAKLLSTADSVTYGGEVMLDETKCHLIKATGPEADWQLWIDAGKKPLPRRFVPDMAKFLAKLTKGRPEIAKVGITSATTFKAWQENPQLAAEAFAYQRAPGMVQIENPADQVEPPHGLLGKAAPQADLELLGGGKLDLAALRGKNIVILDFWATWCGPCQQAMPIIEKVAAEYKKKGVLLYLVNQQETPDEVSEFAQQREIVAPIAMDRVGAVARDYLVQGIPQTVLIGKDGTVQVVHIGLSADLESRLRKELASLLEGKDLAAETKAKAEKATARAAETKAKIEKANAAAADASNAGDK